MTTLVAAGMLIGIGQGTAVADVTAVSGGAFGYYTSVAFDFGSGPGPADINGPDPTVTLPSTGGSETASVESATVFSGPALFFASGPITVHTEGSTGPTGSSSSSVSITGTAEQPDPFHYGTIDSTCSSSETGTTGSTTLADAVIVLGGGLEVAVPANPAPNSEYVGTIDGVNDQFRIVVNEQIVTSDSITVNAMHMYLVGPIAHGDVIVGQSHCDVIATTSNQAPTADDDTYSTDALFLEVPEPGLLGNDGDPDGDTLTAQLQSAPANGTVTVNPGGSFLYRPNDGFAGTDTFTYLVRDPRGANDIGTVTIDVTAPPTVVLDNDNFADAKVIAGASGSVVGTTVDATGEDAEPAHANSPFPNSIWYVWTAPDDVRVTFDACLIEPASGFDVYVGDSLGALTLVTSSNTFDQDTDDPDHCRATFQANGGAVFHIAVVPNVEPGLVWLRWTSVPSPGPANDNLADAEVISGPSGSVTGSNVNATEEAGEPDHAFAVGGNGPGATSIWYDWTAPADGEVTFDTCQSRSETSTDNGGWLDTTLAVYTGSSVSALTEVASNDEDLDDLCGFDREFPAGSRVTFTAAAGTTYHIAVDSGPGFPVGTVVLEWKMATGNEPVAVDDIIVVRGGTPGGVNVLANDSDPNGDALTLTLNTSPSSGTVACTPAGVCTYTVDPAYAATRFTDSFRYRVTDANGEHRNATVTVYVNLPEAGDDAYRAAADTPLTVAAPGVLANDTSPFGETLTAAFPSDPAHGSVVLNGDGSFTYVPDSGFTGTDTFTYLALDAEGRPGPPATVTITVSLGCNGRVATIVGTAGADRLFGTAGADVFVGLGGNDSIYGYGGDDTICGGDGSDVISGDAGNDFVDAGAGNDTVTGGAGDDILLGGAGVDRLFATAGNDQLDGGLAVDYCYRGRGTTTFTGCEVYPAGR